MKMLVTESTVGIYTDHQEAVALIPFDDWIPSPASNGIVLMRRGGYTGTLTGPAADFVRSGVRGWHQVPAP